MYHLSKELAGIVLPADTYGTHLKDGKTVDEVLEEKNFKAAGEVLAEVWSNLVIDNHPVTSEYVDEKPSELITSFSATPAFKSRHLIQTQYMTIALKCDNLMCCSPPKTIIHKFFPGRRVPALIPLKQTASGPEALPLSPNVTKEELSFLDVFQRLSMESILMPEELKIKYNGMVPYDVYFPTLQQKVEERVCKLCRQYFALKLSLKEHKQVGHKRSRDEDGPCTKEGISNVAAHEVLDEFLAEDEERERQENLEDSDDDVLEQQSMRPLISVPAAGGIETIVNLKEWLKSPYQLISELS